MVNSSSSSANFDKRVLQQIWGDNPADPLYPRTDIVRDWAHVLGRNRGDKAYSSPLNSFPLNRLTHQSGYRDKRHYRAMLLEIAREKVEEAIREGRYQYTDTDAAFREISEEWYLNNFHPEA